METDMVYSLAYNNQFQIVEKNHNKSNKPETSQALPKFKQRNFPTQFYSTSFNNVNQIISPNAHEPNPAEPGSGDYKIIPTTVFKKVYYNNLISNDGESRNFPDEGVGSYSNYGN